MKWIYKISIVAPFLFLIFLLFAYGDSNLNLYFMEVDLYIYSRTVILIYVLIVAFLILCSTLRNPCCNGTVFELIYNLLSIQLFLLVVFAQYCLLVALSILPIGFLLVSIFAYVTKDKKYMKDKKQQKRVIARFLVLILSFLLTGPSAYCITTGKLKNQEYEGTEYVSSDATIIEIESRGSKEFYIDNASVFSPFFEEQWSTMSYEKKMDHIQRFVYFESVNLGITSPSVKATVMNRNTLGEYSLSEHEITINLSALCSKTEGKDVIQHLLHEIWHAYQNEIVKMTEWDNPITKTQFYYEVSTWKYNQEHYISPSMDYELYYEQPLEASAREFAENEIERILGVINL